MLITREFKFDAAHHLTNYRGKCENVHGHTYKLAVTLRGDVQSNGLVVDFAVLKRIVKKYILDELDHKDINTVIKNPSAENIALWIWERLKDFGGHLKNEADDSNLVLPENCVNLELHEVKLWESENNYVTINGENF